MTTTTYISQSEVESWPTISDSVITELLAELMQKTNETWLVKEFLGRSTIFSGVLHNRYTLYKDLKCGEFQVLNLDSSRKSIVSYLLGYLSGINLKNG